MTIQEAIQKKRIIEISFSSNLEQTYSGVCLKANSHIWLIINYDFKKKKFDGFSVFKNKDIDSYSVYKKKGLTLKNNNLDDFINILKMDKIKTFYSCFKQLGHKELIAFFTEDNTREYNVGQILSINRQSMVINLMDIDGKWTQTKTIKMTGIDYFSFMTRYEKALSRKASRKLTF